MQEVTKEAAAAARAKKAGAPMAPQDGSPIPLQFAKATLASHLHAAAPQHGPLILNPPTTPVPFLQPHASNFQQHSSVPRAHTSQPASTSFGGSPYLFTPALPNEPRAYTSQLKDITPAMTAPRRDVCGSSVPMSQHQLQAADHPWSQAAWPLLGAANSVRPCSANPFLHTPTLLQPHSQTPFKPQRSARSTPDTLLTAVQCSAPSPPASCLTAAQCSAPRMAAASAGI
jgi:hypothetical protein